MDNKEKYMKLCEQEGSICIYDQPWWLDVVCGPDNWNVLLVEDEKGVIQGTLTYYIKKKFGINYITQPQLTQHNGVWIRQNDDREFKRLGKEHSVMTMLIDQLEKLPVAYYRQAFSPKIKNWLPFYWKGYLQTTCYTYILDCSDYQNVFENLDKTCRKRVRKSSSEAIIYESNDIEKFYSLQCKVFKRQNLKNPYSLEFIKRLYEICKEHDCVKLIFAKDAEDNIYCTNFVVWDNSYIYLLMSGIDSKYRQFNYNYALTDYLIRLANLQGKKLDFEGSMLKGVEEYNRKFNAIQTPYFNISKVLTRNIILKTVIERFRR